MVTAICMKKWVSAGVCSYKYGMFITCQKFISNGDNCGKIALCSLKHKSIIMFGIFAIDSVEIDVPLGESLRFTLSNTSYTFLYRVETLVYPKAHFPTFCQLSWHAGIETFLYQNISH